METVTISNDQIHEALMLSWFATWSNIVELADWLVHERLYDAEALLAFIEKPWHYDNEWAEYHDALKKG